MRWWRKELAVVDAALAASVAAGERADAVSAQLDATAKTREAQRRRVDRRIRQNGFGHELELVVKIPIAGAR